MAKTVAPERRQQPDARVASLLLCSRREHLGHVGCAPLCVESAPLRRIAFCPDPPECPRQPRDNPIAAYTADGDRARRDWTSADAKPKDVPDRVPNSPTLTYANCSRLPQQCRSAAITRVLGASQAEGRGFDLRPPLFSGQDAAQPSPQLRDALDRRSGRFGSCAAGSGALPGAVWAAACPSGRHDNGNGEPEKSTQRSGPSGPVRPRPARPYRLGLRSIRTTRPAKRWGLKMHRA